MQQQGKESKSEVTWEDQQNINKFGRLNNRLHDLVEEIKIAKMKKKQKILGESSSAMDLKSIIHDHTLFFDKLIELIPARFYLPTDDKDKPWVQGLSKAKRASMKQESKENVKKARRNRMDPEKSNTTTLDLLKQNLKNEKANADKSNSEADDVEVEINPLVAAAGMEDEERSVTYEVLRQRLREKIEMLRSQRNLGESNRAKKRSDYREYINKRKTLEGKENEEDKKVKDVEAMAKVEKDASEAANELAFSYVKLGDDEEPEKKKRKMSKSKELQEAKKLEEAKKDPEKGEIIAKKHSWTAATQKAAGIKIHDDPKLLTKSMHKDKKRREKNANKWKERAETVDNMKAEKQQTRSKNIAERINDKKQRRIAKREKKLMRPGFEGRKKGFITEG